MPCLRTAYCTLLPRHAGWSLIHAMYMYYEYWVSAGGGVLRGHERDSVPLSVALYDRERVGYLVCDAENMVCVIARGTGILAETDRSACRAHRISGVAAGITAIVAAMHSVTAGV